MIKLTQGNLLRSDAEALVNTVNCVGYMGKGIALQFKKRFPDNFDAYHKACKQGLVVPGQMFVFESADMVGKKTIINFPTKRHWRNHSRMEDIESGLIALIEEVQTCGIKSIAIPPLGCGLGGLSWSEVKPKIEAAFASLPDVEVHLYEPKGAPAGKAQPVGTRKPKMTRAQAMIIMLMKQYRALDYELSLLEIHKLAYLLQEQGEDLKLKYSPFHYGPYASNIRFLLQRMEGHYTRGYGDDENPEQRIELMPDAVAKAEQFLAEDENALSSIRAVAQLIDGFETPYGMELLSSVHWVQKKEHIQAEDDVLARIRGWSNRKAELFKPFHIKAALAHLNQ